MAYQDMFLLRNHESFMNAETPIDKLILFRNVALDANGQAVVDFSSTIRDGAEVNYVIFSNTSVNGVNAGAFGTGAIVINRGGVPVSTTAVAADSDSPAVTIPAASKTVLVMFIISASDLRTVNG